MVCSPDSLYFLRKFAKDLTEEDSDFLNGIILLSDNYLIGDKYDIITADGPKDFIESFFIIDEYGKLRYASPKDETEGVSAAKMINQIKTIKENK
jgi:alkyl hydroperoxide reductase subunit AhpC